MRIFGIRNRELFDLLITTFIVLVLSFFAISLQFLENIYRFFYDFWGLSAARFTLNFIFLYLAGLLWLTYRRWRRAETKRHELENVITSIDPDTLIVTDPNRNIIMCNSAMERMFGYAADEVVNSKIDMLYYDPQSLSEHWREIHKVLGKEAFHIELATGRRKDGTLLTLEIVTGSLHSFNGTVSLLRDVTERKKTEDEIKEAHGELTQIFNSSSDGMWVVDKDFQVLRINTTLARLLGLPEDLVPGKKCYELFQCPYHGGIACSMKRIESGDKHYDGEIEIASPGNAGTTKTCLLTAAPFEGRKGELIGIIEDFRNITVLKEMEQRLLNMSLVDDLTGLYNRRGFFTLAEQQIKLANRTKRGLLLLFIDIDRMKWINDTLGHAEGDEALKETAEAIKNTMRSSDLVARMGGDEFVALAIEAIYDDKPPVIARLQRHLDLINGKAGRTYELSLSIGSAYYEPEKPCSVDELVRRADMAMYEHKRSKLL
jgi:diguanylate cyclase (GGDEF)-like protein/PAS domain S-box-containing protein